MINWDTVEEGNILKVGDAAMRIAKISGGFLWLALLGNPHMVKFSFLSLGWLQQHAELTIELEENWVTKTGDACACFRALENGARNAKFGTYGVFINERKRSLSLSDNSTVTVCAYSIKDAFTWEEKE